jgi:hypothetical protein
MQKDIQRNPERTIFVVLSDTHAGSKYALLNPDAVLFSEDENGNMEPYKPKLTASQEYLWSIYQQDMQGIIDLAAGDPIVVLHNGDLTQGNKHIALLVSDRVSDHVAIGTANLMPWFKLPNLKAFRVCIGTAAHNLNLGAAELLIYQQLQTMFPSTNLGVCYHGILDVDGVTIDYAHHGPPTGVRNWLKGNVARLYLKDIMYNDILAHQRPPDLVLRGHYHEYVTEVVYTDGNHSRLVITPSYSMLDDYAQQAVKSVPYITNGLIAFEIVKGKLSEPIEFVHKLDVRRRETI